MRSRDISESQRSKMVISRGNNWSFKFPRMSNSGAFRMSTKSSLKVWRFISMEILRLFFVRFFFTHKSWIYSSLTRERQKCRTVLNFVTRWESKLLNQRQEIPLKITLTTFVISLNRDPSVFVYLLTLNFDQIIPKWGSLEINNRNDVHIFSESTLKSGAN